MSKTSLLVSVLLCVAAGTAGAGGQPGSIGVGAEYQLNGIGGLSVNYDAGLFHVGGSLGYADPQGPVGGTFQLAGRFYYHVHHSAFADFGIGGSLGLDSFPVAMSTNRSTAVYLEPGFEIRAFLSSNVALSATGGIVIGAADAGGVGIAGNTIGGTGGPVFGAGVGIHYYFY
ncbi:MAG TPA: hypothetical protein VFQ65_21365 [Kofleriaceae bacterium]|nr:hypothetical protein [Kofleriaceae bacterium]